MKMFLSIIQPISLTLALSTQKTLTFLKYLQIIQYAETHHAQVDTFSAKICLELLSQQAGWYFSADA